MTAENNEIGLLDPSDADLSEDDLRHAALVVCGMSTDVDDARELLMMLGLT